MIGNLSHIMTLQEKIRTADEGGGYTEVWQNLALNPVLHAAVQDLSGNEAVEARQVIPRAACKLVFRYRNDVAVGMRFTEGSIAYHIVSLKDPDGKKALLEALAEKTGA